MTDRKQAYICKSFDMTARKAFPYKSMYQITKELNSLLEKVLYDNEPTQKRKRK